MLKEDRVMRLTEPEVHQVRGAVVVVLITIPGPLMTRTDLGHG